MKDKLIGDQVIRVLEQINRAESMKKNDNNKKITAQDEESPTSKPSNGHHQNLPSRALNRNINQSLSQLLVKDGSKTQLTEVKESHRYNTPLRKAKKQLK